MRQRIWQFLRPQASIATAIRAQIKRLKTIPPSRWTAQDLETLANLSRFHDLISQYEVTTLRRLQWLAAILIPVWALYAALAPAGRTLVTIEGTSSYLQFRPIATGSGIARDFPVEQLSMTLDGDVELTDVLGGERLVPGQRARSLAIESAQGCKVTLDGIDWPARSTVQVRAIDGRFGIRLRAADTFALGAAVSGECQLRIDETIYKVKSSSGRLVVAPKDAFVDLQFARTNAVASYFLGNVRTDAIDFSRPEGPHRVSGLIDARISFDALPDRLESIREREALFVVPATDLSLDQLVLAPEGAHFRVGGEVTQLRGGNGGVKQLMPKILDQVRDSLRIAVLVIYAGVLLWRRDYLPMKELA